MKHVRTTLLLLIAVSSAPTFSLAADAEAGLLAIKVLGSVNGQALACAEALPAGQRSEGQIKALKKKLEAPLAPADRGGGLR